MTGGIAVFAYSQIGHDCLKALIDRGETIDVLFTHRDQPQETRWFDSCADLAKAHGIPVSYSEPGDGAEMERLLLEARPALILSFYYRRMIPTRILAMATDGAYNMHGSLLPRYRGRAPINWAVLFGESRTGVTLHVMTGRSDAGDIVDQEAVAVGEDDTAGDVMARMAPAAVAVLLRQIEALKAGTAPRRPQDESQASYFGGRGPEDGRIDWSLAADRVVNLVRAVATPFPGAFTTWNGLRLMVWRARRHSGSGRPGEVLSVEPLVVAAGTGAVEILSHEWRQDGQNGSRADAPASLQRGAVLGVA